MKKKVAANTILKNNWTSNSKSIPLFIDFDNMILRDVYSHRLLDIKKVTYGEGELTFEKAKIYFMDELNNTLLDNDAIYREHDSNEYRIGYSHGRMIYGGIVYQMSYKFESCGFVDKSRHSELSVLGELEELPDLKLLVEDTLKLKNK